MRLERTTQFEPYRRWLVAQGLSTNTIEQRVEFAHSRVRGWGTLDQPAHVVAEWLGLFDGWTKRTYLNHLRSLYTWLVETGEVSRSPVERYRFPRMPPPRANPLSEHQVAAVLSNAAGDLRAWLLLGLFAGLRCHEIAKVRGEDVTENQLFVIGKGGVHAALPTHPVLWSLAQEYPRQGWWFPSNRGAREYVSESQVGNRVRWHFRGHGIDQGAIHRCRHTYGTDLARAGVQPRIVQDLLRHRSLDTTMRYIAVSDPERAAAIRTLGPSEVLHRIPGER
ncbi:hypothetical protein BH11ACT8_BH11ACT8_12210 [soil metagenome]